MHSVKLSVDERDSVRSVGRMSESCAVLLLGIEFGVLMRAGWGEVCKSLVIVLLLTGEENSRDVELYWKRVLSCWVSYMLRLE